MTSTHTETRTAFSIPRGTPGSAARVEAAPRHARLGLERERETEAHSARRESAGIAALGALALLGERLGAASSRRQGQDSPGAAGRPLDGERIQGASDPGRTDHP